jgi:hypothetical protein
MCEILDDDEGKLKVCTFTFLHRGLNLAFPSKSLHLSTTMIFHTMYDKSETNNETVS